MDKVEQFRKLVAKHDLTYSYSDDGMVYRAGQAERDEIQALAKELPRELAAQIWNAAVDKKIREGHREPFYWEVKP